jgi:hypothetical protein
MKHGIICPIPFLKEFATKSNFHLILPHLVRTHPEYKSFYKECAEKGDFVLLDNSIFELGYSLDKRELLEVAEDVHASEVVAPEVWHNKKETTGLVEDFIQYHQAKKSNIRILAMATGETEEEIIESFFYYNTHPNIDSLGLPFTLDYEITGVSNNVESLTLRRVLNRWSLVEKICAYGNASSQTIKPTHLMGLSDALELQRYKGIRYYWVRSNDSSTAFVHGFNEVYYTDKGLPAEKIKQKLDFNGYRDIGLTISQKSCIHYNIDKILSWV